MKFIFVERLFRVKLDRCNLHRCNYLGSRVKGIAPFRTFLRIITRKQTYEVVKIATEMGETKTKFNLISILLIKTNCNGQTNILRKNTTAANAGYRWVSSPSELQPFARDAYLDTHHSEEIVIFARVYHRQYACINTVATYVDA